MSNFLQFTDAKRFIISMGIALICLSVILPWLVLSQPMLLDVTNTELGDYTLLGQYNVHIRQFMSLGLSGLACCFSPVLFFSGLFITVSSLFFWITKGDTTEEERYALERDRLELKEFKKKGLEETLAREQQLRDLVREMLVRCLDADNVTIENNVLFDDLWYDFQVLTKNLEVTHTLVKVKFARDSKNSALFKMYFNSLIRGWKIFKKHNSVKAKALGIIIHNIPPNTARKDLGLLETGIKFLTDDIKVIQLTEYDITRMSGHELISYMDWLKTVAAKEKDTLDNQL